MKTARVRRDLEILHTISADLRRLKQEVFQLPYYFLLTSS